MRKEIITGFMTLLGFLSLAGSAQNYSKNIFTGNSDIGSCNIKGSLVFNPASQDYVITGSGENIWFGSDQFHFAWRKLAGDFILTANVEFIGEGSQPHRKTGWMIRKSLDPGSEHISGTVHGDGLTSLQYRTSEGADMDERKSVISSPDVIQLERHGNQFIFSCAAKGNPFDTVMITDDDMTGEVYAGLFICSHDNSVSESARFYNVRITIPAKDDFVPYRDFIGSNLEVMDVETGHRKDIYQVPNSIQAPNWTPDGRYLIYNSEGLLYRFNLETGRPEIINSGFAVNNNNDHVLSFDGMMLGISNHVAEDGDKSIIFTMPAGGGKPERITALGPSYLHGWSPDGKFLTYTADRNNNFDIYKISVEKKEEIRLTDAPGLDDGPEYSPDGRYIYFNSARTGKMQLWRMKPDGSQQEQLTSDEYNNWFPHVSPDGKWVVFLSFMPDVKADDHPFYKHVYLRLMPAEGGEPKIIAYLYGGQGTINVPSWSPDSKSIAFVSNSDTVRP
jgi:Tol biopolymer transport system component